MGSAMIVTNVVLENTLGVDIVDDDDVVETIAAQGSVQTPWIRGIVGNQPQNPDSELRAGSAQRGRYRQKPGLFSPGAWA
jgi:hypothetical protein